jgi:hypothetical protein
MFDPALNLATTIGPVATISLAATIVEALPFRDIDNFTLTTVAILLGYCLLWVIADQLSDQKIKPHLEGALKV